MSFESDTPPFDFSPDPARLALLDALGGIGAADAFAAGGAAPLVQLEAW